MKQPIITYNGNLLTYSQELRSNMTQTERILWRKIKSRKVLGVQFYRQKMLGNFILDFYAKKPHLAIELDGMQHFDTEHQKKDQNRDYYLKTLGVHTLRFTNLEILQNLPQVLLTIQAAIANLR